VAAVKLGARGCLVFDRPTDRIVRLPSAAARVVDTTGAGDAFCGGFLAGYARTGDGIEAALHGIISASFTVETIGIPPPGTVRRQDVDDRLAAYRQTR
jgi:ribokinase